MFKYTAVVLAALVFASDAVNVVNNPDSLVLAEAPSQQQEKIDGWSLSADVNDYVDNTIHMISPFIQQYGLDPMVLPDLEEGFEVRPLLITYSAWLRLNNGRMTGMSQIARSGDQMVHYFAKMLRVRVELSFSNLRFDYRYLCQVMNIGPTGGIVGTLDSYKVAVDLLIDFNNDEVHLQEFSISEIGRLRVRFTGNILTDWLVNPVLNIFIRLFDSIIIRVVEVNIRNAVNIAIGFINTNLKDIFAALESFN